MSVDSRASVVGIDAILPKVGKPARYTGGEWNSVVKDWQSTDLRVVLAYPDIYEIGASHLGLQILYELLNSRRDVLAERTYAPWIDMEAQMRDAKLPLFALESRQPVASFDVLGFTLPYELTYSNVLNMLSLAGIPLQTFERNDGDPLVIGGGSCTFNPEPLAEFFDLFVIGDGEEVFGELLDAFRESGWRPHLETGRSNRQRSSFLKQVANIQGIYVPALYDAAYSEAGVLTRPAVDGAPRRVLKRFVASLPFAPVRPVVPYLEAVHDRAAVEIMRGCTRGCRFCQAGVIYRSVRERPVDEILAMVDQVLANTGYEELGLMSLSSADHSEIKRLVQEIVRRHPNVNVSLPSLRVDSFSVDLASAIRRRKTGFTFAPEAGSQRMRDAINKHITEEDILRAAEAAFGQGWSLIKLYFLIGLPGEVIDDVADIAALVKKMLSIGRRYHRHRAQINVSVNTFCPKPQTPFQWAGQDSDDSLREKQQLLQRELRGVKLGWSDNRVSAIEAALARGDRRMGGVLEGAWRRGARFDAWSDQFVFERWQEAFSAAGLDSWQYSHRPRSLEEALPWDHIDSGISKAYLKEEYNRSVLGQFTPDCHVHDRCSACGHFKLDPNCVKAVKRAEVAANI
ncbi:MAG: TIGR03960 family B12-binding radical SAM protein [Chloroflexi bacterium]|nr:TIGR03960 family B12-binding radical SAM protein [Chloroflexota bacterium]